MKDRIKVYLYNKTFKEIDMSDFTKITEDLFTAPVSNYSKTLWYNTYDVSSLLHK